MNTHIPRSTNAPEVLAIKAVVESIIESASTSNIDLLKNIYHDDMQIQLFDQDRTLHQMNKSDFIAHLSTIMATEAPSTWADFHLVEANEQAGHVLISRQVPLSSDGQIITLSIDFVHEDGRWQIIREVIFTHKVTTN